MRANIFALVIYLWEVSSMSLIKTNIFIFIIRLENVFKTFSRRPQEVFKTSRRFKDVFKTSYKNVFKTSSRPLAKVSCQGALKTSSKDLQNLLQRCLQDIFKAFPRRYQVELYLLTRPHNVAQAYSTRF